MCWTSDWCFLLLLKSLCSRGKFNFHLKLMGPCGYSTFVSLAIHHPATGGSTEHSAFHSVHEQGKRHHLWFHRCCRPLYFNGNPSQCIKTDTVCSHQRNQRNVSFIFLRRSEMLAEDVCLDSFGSDSRAVQHPSLLPKESRRRTQQSLRHSENLLGFFLVWCMFAQSGIIIYTEPWSTSWTVYKVERKGNKVNHEDVVKCVFTVGGKVCKWPCGLQTLKVKEAIKYNVFLPVLTVSCLVYNYCKVESTYTGIATSGTPTDLIEPTYCAVVKAGDFCDG